MLTEKIEKQEESGKTVLLKDNVINILMTPDMNFDNNGKGVLIKLVRDERMIYYNNLFFKTGNSSIKNFDFSKRFGTLYDLLIDLLNKKNEHQ